MAKSHRAKAAGETMPDRAPTLTAYEMLDVTLRNAVAIVSLNRPDVHNAFNEELIAELTSVLRALGDDDIVRAVVLMGTGESFCAGADLNWMRQKIGRASCRERV